MANGFQYLAQSMAPDILGSFERGRAQARQTDRERLADQELRSQLERGNRLRQLAPRALTAATPGDRQQVLGEIAAVDPRAAPEYEQQFADRDQRARASLGNAALLLTSVPPEARAGLYQREFLPNLRSLGIELPDQYTPEVDATAMKIASVLSRQMGGQTPARVAGFQGMTQGMSPEDTERARRVELGLEGRAASGGMSMQKITGPDGREYAVVFDPRTGQPRPVSMEELFAGQGQGQPGSPQGAMPGMGGGQPQMSQGGAPAPQPALPQGPAGTPFAGLTPAEKAAQEARARAGVDLQTKPQIARETTLAEQRARAEAEREATAPQRAEKLRLITSNIDNTLSEVDRAVKTIDWNTTGPIGAITRAFPGTDAYHLNQLLTTVKANLGFDRLQAMRDASPTGGALGQVAVQELQALQAAVASLDQAQTGKQLNSSLEKVRAHYANWKDAVTKAPTGNQAAPAGNDGWSIVEE